jgi:hypothetical protein
MKKCWRSVNTIAPCRASAGKTVFAQFTNARSIHPSFHKGKMKDDDKKGDSTVGN